MHTAQHTKRHYRLRRTWRGGISLLAAIVLILTSVGPVFAVMGTTSTSQVIPVFDSQFGFVPSRLDGVKDVAVATDGTIFALRDDRVVVMDNAGAYVRTFGSAGTADGQFSDAIDMAVDSSDNVYVIDRLTTRIQKFDSAGTFVATWSGVTPMDGPQAFPRGIAIDANDDVYTIVSNGSGDLSGYVFEADGTAKSGWQGGISMDPQVKGIAVDSNTSEVYMLTGSNIAVYNLVGTLVTNWPLMNLCGTSAIPNSIMRDASGNSYVSASTASFSGNDACITQLDGSGATIAQWGSYGEANEQMKYPGGMAIDSAGDLYIADRSNHRVQKSSLAGVFMAAYGHTRDNGQLLGPNAVAYDTSGNMYIADSGNSRIQKFDSSGTFISTWGAPGVGDGQLSGVAAVTVSLAGEVYVTQAHYDTLTSTTTAQIQKFDSNGTFLARWGTDGTANGEFYFPSGIVTDAAGNIYVADGYNYRIQKFDSSGTFLTKWGSNGTGDGQFNYPAGIAIDSAGDIYVVDSFNDRIQKFDSSGTFLTKWGSNGTGDGQFNQPWGITADTTGSIYVVDTNNHRIQKFDSSGTFLTKWGSQGDDANQFSQPRDLIVTHNGTLAVADTLNNRIQLFSLPQNLGTIPAATGTAASNLTLTEGNNITDISSLPAPSNLATDYPLGFVDVTFTPRTSGGTEQMQLFFETTLTPDQVAAYKYNTTTSTTTAMTGVTISSTTHNGKQGLLLTYNVTDGGIYDEDGTVNNQITDPVGLRVLGVTTDSSAGGLAETGVDVHFVLLTAATLVGLSVSTLIYRRTRV